MARSDRLGELEAVVLASVVRAGADVTGVRVYEEIERQVGRAPSVSGVHVTLRRLETKGLLTSTVGPRSPRGGKPQRFYRLTPEGAHALADFREMWERLWNGLTVPSPESLR